ncbi:MAG TPA: hypothetical protein VJT74_03705 [Pyrinomonadaceae bacterium]|nr:hypothetical protein [Pyrinomonadaceae bacterium]
MSKKTAMALLQCLVIYLVGTCSVCGQEKKITIKMESRPIGVVFKYLMEKYDIPIGFEESTLDRASPDFEFYANLPTGPKIKIKDADGKVKVIPFYGRRVFRALIRPITIDVKNESLAEVFDKIVWQMENYKWELNDGVVNIFPIKGRDERFAKLLGLKVQRFTFDKGETVRDITKYLKLVPELITFLAENKLNFRGFRGETKRTPRAEYGRAINVEMDFSNLTFRDLLNKITRIKRGGWALKWKWKSETTGLEEIDIDI